MPDLQKTGNIIIFLNNKELARSCLRPTLENFALAFQRHDWIGFVFMGNFQSLSPFVFVLKVKNINEIKTKEYIAAILSSD